jgi:predicted glycosyltransferase
LRAVVMLESPEREDERAVLLLYCQHSLGLGHLTRSLALSESLSGRFRVALLCGGKLPATAIAVPDGVTIVELPPLGAGADGRLVSRDGRRSLQRARVTRRKMIIDTFRSLRPEVLITEFFPFGKRRFAGEIIPLLEEAQRAVPAPLIVSSIRDILVTRWENQQEHDDNASGLLNRYFDAVLVHSDARFARIEDSFHPRIPLHVPIHYTGFVVPNGTASTTKRARAAEVVVSAGGGIVGEPLLRAAVEAYRRIGPDPGFKLKVIAGPFLPPAAWRSLRAECETVQGLTLRRSVHDLLAELRAATASISQCGYNTALDLIRARVPALVVPFSGSEEDEQLKRAGRMRELGAARVLERRDLDPTALADEMRTLLEFRPRPVELDFDGGANSLRVLMDLASRRPRAAGVGVGV